MQVIIEEVVSRIRTMDGGAGIAPETLRNIVTAVLDAMAQCERQRQNWDEELSLRNYQQRNQPWDR